MDHPSSRKLKVNLLQVSDLEDFKDVLKEKIQMLKNVEPDDIVFLNYDYCNILILPNTLLKPLADNIMDLKIQIKRKKVFRNWTLKEVGSEIYKNTFNSIDSIQKLNLEEFSELNSSFNKEKIEYFIKQLKDKAFAFNNKISSNKAISELDGSQGYGNLDYKVVIQDVPVLINKAKKQNIEKRVAQNLAQIDILKDQDEQDNN
ncbi:5408_t:CDS:2 [Dentiscutata erythropus]|uniref:5408_t:CDS:1 n=1 Tax=Dentiscutata erythropus TaxID=1348616 RepID=A0A9N9AGY4_9GLOM|nr:5408_t:CDS:2 [Dentiscutata erythropus]